MDLSAWAMGGGRWDVFRFLEGTASVGPSAAAPFPPALPSPAELVLVSVYVQLDFSDAPWPAALSQPLTVPAASVSSAPVTLAGLNLTTGGEEPLLTPSLSMALSCSGGRGSSGCKEPSPPTAPWSELLRGAPPYFLEGLRAQLLPHLPSERPSLPAPCPHLLNFGRGPRGR